MSDVTAKERTMREDSAEALRCNGTGSHDDIVMESMGVTEADCPDYIEEDDVESSIAEGYF